MTGPDHRRRIAAFDVDGTLTTTDCVVPFLRRTAGTARLAGRLLHSPVSLAASVVRRDRDAMKSAAAAAAFRGVPLDRLVADAEAFAEEVATRRLRPDVVEHLERHLADGDTVVLVSASFEVYLRPLARRLGVHHVLGVRLAVDGSDRLTGDLDGPNCRGPEKVRRLHGWLDAEAGGRAAVHVTAYGDSTGDRELLGDADEAHWVGRGSIPW